MDRFTTRIENNVYYTKGKYPQTLPAECENWDVRYILKRLADYEDTGLDPKEILNGVELAHIAYMQKKYKQMHSLLEDAAEEIENLYNRETELSCEIRKVIDYNKMTGSAGVKVVKPDLVSYMIHGNDKLPDYRCPECGYGVAEDYECCPHCKAELDWKHLNEKSKEFKKLIDKL